jgi:hypothetical protein
MVVSSGLNFYSEIELSVHFCLFFSAAKRNGAEPFKACAVLVLPKFNYSLS